MSKINEYLPKILQPIVEFQQINSDLDVELTNINKLINNIENEVIVQTASEYGIKKWENTLGLIPSDSDSLEVRRFRIINILTSKLPYTLRWLQGKLTQIVGSESGWTLNIDSNHYIITIILSGLDTKLMLEVEKQLRGAIPANMELEIGGPNITSSIIKIGIGMRYAVRHNVVAAYDLVKFEYNMEYFEEGSIAEDGSLDESEAGVAITSCYTMIFDGREYEFGNNEGYSAYGLAFYDMFGNLISRQKGLNTNQFTTPEGAQLIRVTIMDERGIRTTDITNAYVAQL